MTEFEKLVLEMRKAQKAYFKTRDKNILPLSKQLEKRVDEYLESKDKPTLFP